MTKKSSKKLVFLYIKTAIYLSLVGFHKGSPSYRRILQPSKENITWKFYFLWVISNPDSDPWPAWIRILFGSYLKHCFAVISAMVSTPRQAESLSATPRESKNCSLLILRPPQRTSKLQEKPSVHYGSGSRLLSLMRFRIRTQGAKLMRIPIMNRL